MDYDELISMAQSLWLHLNHERSGAAAEDMPDDLFIALCALRDETGLWIETEPEKIPLRVTERSTDEPLYSGGELPDELRVDGTVYVRAPF